MSLTERKVLCRYRYDPLDRLVGQLEPGHPDLQRFYCRHRLATEIQGALRHSLVQHADLLLAQQSQPGETRLLATDQQRSILHALGSTGERNPMAYSAYGHRPAENGLLSLLGFNGERPDPITGHYLLGNGYRAFNPALMRFNSPDSWSPFGPGGLNSYAYCLGDPINRKDDNGHFPIGLIKIIPFEPIRKFIAKWEYDFLESSLNQILTAEKSVRLEKILEYGLSNSEYSKFQQFGINNSKYSQFQQYATLKQRAQFTVLQHNLPQTGLPRPMSRELASLQQKIKGSPQWIRNKITQFKVLNGLPPSTEWSPEFDYNLRHASHHGSYDLSLINEALYVWSADVNKIRHKMWKLRREFGELAPGRPLMSRL